MFSLVESSWNNPIKAVRRIDFISIGEISKVRIARLLEQQQSVSVITD